MNRAEFMARAIIALGTNIETWVDGDGNGGHVVQHSMRSPKQCAERAQELWEAYSAATAMRR